MVAATTSPASSFASKTDSPSVGSSTRDGKPRVDVIVGMPILRNGFGRHCSDMRTEPGGDGSAASVAVAAATRGGGTEEETGSLVPPASALPNKRRMLDMDTLSGARASPLILHVALNGQSVNAARVVCMSVCAAGRGGDLLEGGRTQCTPAPPLTTVNAPR